MWHVEEVVKAVKGKLLRIGKSSFSGISTDSRTIMDNELFIPLTGKNFDGHQFIRAAYDRSHAGSICEKGRQDTLHAGGTVILVDDAMQALLDLAYYKKGLTRSSIIAITGSNGKTTTKEILVNIIKKGFSVHYNEKNYNNAIGISKSILSIEGDPQFCIFELGTNNKGEIKQLARLTEPDVSLITNVNPSHLEGLLNLDGVLEEKLSLFYNTKEGGKVIVNADDPNILIRYKDNQHVLTTYGIINNADFTLSVEEDLGWKGSRIVLKCPGVEIRTRTTLLGGHNLYNILAASTIACSIGIDSKLISEGVETFDPYMMRFKPVESDKGYIILDDTYNANPSSMEWAIKTLLDLPCNGKKMVILGDMKELGEETSFYHRKLGMFLNDTGIPMILITGEYMKETLEELNDGRAIFFENKEQLIDYAAKNLKKGDTVLVKGSRAAKMEIIVEALK
ncbi:MAG: UDP-N-acetylmuramoyl-tripeptide--D-alanyl-D-alanine ligase [Proteobacteria bacterium]|nr:UDP-N-acetylmuramoyl-tripeptide--D-alanyl-D-alanine ligase [Pseudomonadota bacterium]